MGKILEQKITRFDGGFVNDPREQGANIASMVTNFDALTDKHRIIPYRDSGSGDDAPTTSRKQNFAIALWTPTGNYRIFALGVQSAALTRAEILMKDLTTSGTDDLADNTWITPAANQGGQNTVDLTLFVYYRKTGKIYGAHTGTHIWAFTPDGSTAFANTHNALTHTFIGQGLVHSKDDILYIPYHNSAGAAGAKSFIAKNDNGSWTNAALTLPDHLIPISISEYGNYLAIGCAPASGIGNSVVYLWDRDASLATLSEGIDWGSGILKVLEEVDGLLLGISIIGGLATSGIASAASTTFNDRIIFRYLSGEKAVKLKTLKGSTSSQLPVAKQKIDNRLYFMMQISLHGATREGVFSIGRSSEDSPISLVHERTPNNDTALVSGTLYNFFVVGDFMFISYLSSSAYALSKTNDQSSFTATSIYESKILNGDDSSITKKLLGVTVMFEPLPAAGQVVLKYKKNEDIDGSTFTTIYTHTTDDSISHSAINIESSGANLPEFKELVLRIESTGGAVITGIKYRYEAIEKDIY